MSDHPDEWIVPKEQVQRIGGAALEQLKERIRLQQEATERSARIEKAHNLYKIGEFTQSEFLDVMRKEAGGGV